MTDDTGEVTYSARYTPWGDTLDASGTGNLTFGYPSIELRAGFGGLMDVATGLLYVVMGSITLAPALRLVQCRCNPSTGRFLTRNAKPNQTNPYVPFDPTGAMLGHIRNFNEHPAGQNFICIMLNCPLGMAETAEADMFAVKFLWMVASPYPSINLGRYCSASARWAD